jgi:hypothetical protein
MRAVGVPLQHARLAWCHWLLFWLRKPKRLSFRNMSGKHTNHFLERRLFNVSNTLLTNCLVLFQRQNDSWRLRPPFLLGIHEVLWHETGVISRKRFKSASHVVIANQVNRLLFDLGFSWRWLRWILSFMILRFKILWPVDPLLGNDCGISNYPKAVVSSATIVLHQRNDVFYAVRTEML